MGTGTFIKLALVGGTVYLTKQLGIWDTPDTTVELYENVKVQLQPYAANIKQRFCCKPCEECVLPDPPPPWRDSWGSTWNDAVQKTFAAIARVPEYCERFSEDVQQTVFKFSKSDTATQEDDKK